jgi:type IV pilus assembly protein PilN
MIRVNLLPLADRRKKRSVKLPTMSAGGPVIVWVIAAVVVFGGMVAAISMLQARTLRDLDGKVAEARRESAELAPQLQKIRQLTREREEVNRRLGVIASLDRDRYFRVQLLNDISTKLPSNCWLTSVRETSPTSMTIEGVTFSNYTVADLMVNLEQSELFGVVGLTIAQEGRIEDHKVIQFTLDSSVSMR